MNVVTCKIHFDAKLLKSFRNNAKVINTCIFNNYITLGHSSKPYKRTYFNHIRKNGMCCAVHFFYSS